MKSGAPDVPPTNPFPGLRPFEEKEEFLFFGRENQVDAMVNKLDDTHFLSVVGTSGSGKSSLVNCGLRPALYRGLMSSAGTSWRMAQFRPGSNPVQEMSRALAKNGVLFSDYEQEGLTLAEIIETTLRMSKLGLIDIYEQAQLSKEVNLLLVVDQFEELFRYQKLGVGLQKNISGLDEDATAFVNLLLEVSEQNTIPIYIVLTMRSDFLGDCTKFPGLAEAINAGQYLIPRLTRDERRAAIAGPIRVSEAEIAPVLLTRLVNDVGDKPDQLSILQHALNRTWARWQYEGTTKVPLELTHYEAIGTMAHALDQHAEKAYSELDTARKQEICRKIFKGLTDKATDVRGIRRPTTMGTLCALADATQVEIAEVIDVFRQPSRSFVMPPTPKPLEAETVVDISHESLMRVWKRLNGWAEEEAHSAQRYRRLTETARLHKEGKASLWSDPDLQLALNWQEKEKPTAAWAEQYDPEFRLAMDFLQKSMEAREAERAREAKEAERQREFDHVSFQNKVKAVVLLIATGALVIAGGFWWNASKAHREVSLSLLIAKATHDLDENPEGSLLLALPAAVIAETEDHNQDLKNEAMRVLRRAVQKSRIRQTMTVHTDKVVGVAFSPDGKSLATASEDTTAKVLDVSYGKELFTLPGHQQIIRRIAYSPDGARLATGYENGKVKIWDSATGKEMPLSSDLGHGKSVNDLAFNLDGTQLATASEDKTAKVWDAESGKELFTLKGHKKPIRAVTFSMDGKYLATASEDKTAKVWDAESGRAIVWSTESGEKFESLDEHKKSVTSVAFSPNGKLLVTGSGDNTVKIWDISSGVEAYPELKGHTRTIYNVAFSPDGLRLATGSGDTKVIMWDVKSQRQLFTLTGHKNSIYDLAFSPDGRRLATASYERIGKDTNRVGVVKVWNVGPSEEWASLEGHTRRIKSFAFSPNGKYLATASKKETILWDTTSGNKLQTLFTSAQNSVPTIRIIFSADGTRLATVGEKANVVSLRDPFSGEMPDSLSVEAGNIKEVAFSSDGRQLVTAGLKKNSSNSFTIEIGLWDATNGEPLHSLTRHKTASKPILRLSADGDYLATTVYDNDSKKGVVTVWDTASGKEVSSFTGHTQKITQLAFSPNGGYLAASSYDKKSKKGLIKVWNRASNVELASLAGHTKKISMLAFSPDGNFLATASHSKGDKTVKIWELKSNQSIPKEREFARSITSLTFSSDGKHLATAHNDKTVEIWEWNAGEEVYNILEYEKSVEKVAFSPNGFLVAIETWGRTVHLNVLKHQALLCLALSRITRGLEKEECKGCPDTAESSRLFVEGKRLAISGEIESGVVRFKKVLNLIPDLDLNPESKAKEYAAIGKEAKGRQLARQRKIKEATAIFQEAANLDPSLRLNPEQKARKYAAITWIAEARRLARKGDLEGATENFQMAGILDPSLENLREKDEANTEAKRHAGAVLVLRGKWLAKNKKIKEATRNFQKAVDLGQNLSLPPEQEAKKYVAMAWIAEARRLARKGDVAKAEVGFRTAENLNPSLAKSLNLNAEAKNIGKAVALVMDGKIEARAGQVEQAIISFRGAEDLDPGLILNPKYKAGKLAAKYYQRKGRRAASQGNREEAIAHFKEAQVLDPALTLDPETEANKLVVRALIVKGRGAARQGTREEAIAHFKEAKALDPALTLDPETEVNKLVAQTSVRKGQQAARKENREEAIAYFEEAKALDLTLTLDPEGEASRLVAEALVRKGRREARKENLAAAIEYFKEAQALDPALILDPEKEVSKLVAQTSVRKGQQAARKGEIEKAIALYKNAQKIDVSQFSVNAWNTLCWHGTLEGEAKKILFACEEAVALDPENGGNHDSRGVALVLAGHWERAKDDFKYYVEWAPGKRSKTRIDRRREWVRIIEKGRPPFDETILETLRTE